MRTSKYIFFTLKDFKSKSHIMSHKLMIRSGMIRKLSSGLYYWLPIGIRVLKKIENVIKQEMNKIGAVEISIPIIQPISLWKKSGRYKDYGEELLSCIDRKKRCFVISPTNEEAITELIKNENISYKNFPIIYYQIQKKFRDEIRPKFGVIRSKEFLMKDAYSFHIDKSSMEKTYFLFKNAYKKIFDKIGVKFKFSIADSGAIGGKVSHEFYSLSRIEKQVFDFSRKKILKNFNNEKDIFFLNYLEFLKKNFLLSKYDMFNSRNTRIFFLSIKKNIKYPFIILLLKYGCKLDEEKLKKIPFHIFPIRFIQKKEIISMYEIEENNFSKLISIDVPKIIDINFISYEFKFEKYENQNNSKTIMDYHLISFFDISKECLSKEFLLKYIYKKYKKNRIEIAHIFQIGEKYSLKTNTVIQCKNNVSKNVLMGCYGIGIDRLVSSLIEQNYDKYGIVWPDLVSPFKLAILAVNIKDPNVCKLSKEIYNSLRRMYKIDTLLDDRDKGIGVMLSDIELIGIPHILIVSNKLIIQGKVEYRNRNDYRNIKFIKISKIFNFLVEKLKTK
ncbi:hypothetical protein AOQ88_01205 [Candidatus Riesia sp. GBBU]|nr:hypothetical protein AOQ88_01205 [Candidatus Riesia sp. GBBU]